ncbi:hypothetical protein BDN70DRAFT_933441 [Pholiota conissans]|uniref:Uncharacterized protein n=1 Tax=Pholiota conissans TaxID=109636 RepID=A0A9P6CZE8_9AGAR|nr:hypothetical protein BDN70DRAFT_933441 [Pholiota conissans]
MNDESDPNSYYFSNRKYLPIQIPGMGPFMKQWDALYAKENQSQEEDGCDINSWIINPCYEYDFDDGFMPYVIVYFYHCSFDDGANLPRQFYATHIRHGQFEYASYPALVKLVDHRTHPLEVWHHKCGWWQPLDPVLGYQHPDRKHGWNENTFIIIRYADHPCNVNTTGFAELVLELDFRSGHGNDPTSLVPDDMCPADVNGVLIEDYWLSRSSDENVTTNHETNICGHIATSATIAPSNESILGMNEDQEEAFFTGQTAEALGYSSDSEEPSNIYLYWDRL